MSTTNDQDQYHQWAKLSTVDEIALGDSLHSYIYRVPKKLRAIGEDKYEPCVVSIGPYHRDKRNLEVTENHKKLYLKSFVSRSTTPNYTLTTMVNKVREVQDNASKCYDGKIFLSEEDFIRMLILDGCFILELLFRYQLKEQDELDAEDILFNKRWIIPSLRRDLVLLENQIPFDILVCLFQLTLNPIGMFSLNNLIETFFDPILPTIQSTNIDFALEGKHLLDLLRNYLIQTPGNISVKVGENPMWEHTISAVDLQEGGVKFRGKSCNSGLLDITFSDGIFEIPPFFFGDSWTVLFPNMIALEQGRADYSEEITSYAILMDNLINSEKDVKLLRNEGIIMGSSKEDETIAYVVNNLCKEAFYENFHYDGLCYRVNEYRKKPRNRWRANFKRRYVHTPWVGVSIAAAVVLLMLTFAQTVISILQV
ncbi:hypothetical protein ACHQM5_007459 [Ranunculus cassubicifolius]